MVKNKSVQKIAILLLGIVILLAPYLYTMLYAVPSTDDFVMAIKVADRTNLFAEAIRIANEYWLNWAGDWISIFIQIIFNPLLLFGTTSKMYGVEMIVLFLLYVGMMFWAIRNIFVYSLKIKDMTIILSIVLLVLTTILNLNIWTEVFYWFVGSTYLQGMILGFAAIALLSRFQEKGGFLCAVFMSVFGFFACSYYMLAVLPGMIYLLYITVDYMSDKRLNWKRDLPIFIWGIGFLSGLLAPGNYTRLGNETGETGVSIIKTVLDTAILCLDTTFDLIKNPMVLIVMFLVCLLGVISLKNMKFDFKYPLFPFVLAVACLYITYFPVALGYGGSRYLPNRVQFNFCTYAVLTYGAASFYLGGWFYKRYKDVVTKKNIITALVALAVFGYICIMPTKYYQELPYAQTVAQFQSIKNAHSDWTYLLGYIEGSEEKDLFLSRSVINTVIIKEPGLTRDPDYVVNKTIAEYFKKDSIALELW